MLDDGSTDNSLEIIEDFGRRYPFIRILKNETNRGLLYSINRALKEARCDFVVWAAADDRLMPKFLERNVQCLSEHPAAGMTFSRLAVFKDGSDEITSFTEKNYGMAFDFGTVATIPVAADAAGPLAAQPPLDFRQHGDGKPHRADEAGGFDAELRWHADYFSFLAVALRHGAVCIPETLALMRQRPQTYSSEGMANRNEQRATLGRLADKLTTKGWRDLGITVLRCPSLLSPFGGLMLEALVAPPTAMAFCGDIRTLVGKSRMGTENRHAGSAREPLCSHGSSGGIEHPDKIRPICTLGSALMMHDFTLVIPTYNRAQQFGALLGYLETQRCGLPCARPRLQRTGGACGQSCAGGRLQPRRRICRVPGPGAHRKVASGHSQSHNAVLCAVRR